MLDGDNVRHGLNQELGSRRKTARKTSVALPKSKLFNDAGMMVITASLSRPIGTTGRWRATSSAGSFVEVHLATCIALL